MEQTLILIKPDGVKRNLIGKVLARFEEEGLRIVALKMFQMSLELAEAFYAVHREKPFFASLCRYMTSGPIVAAVLEGEEAIGRVREIMGATDPKKAAPGTLRALYGLSVEENTVHGSDSPESAQREMDLIFPPSERVPR